MFENLSYIPGLHATYSSELSAIEAAAERGASTVERERAQLVRADGSPVYTPAEHAERLQAILEAAGADYDAATARYVEQSAREAADLERRLAQLDADPFDALKPDEQQRASVRREFVREDAAALDSSDPARRVEAQLMIEKRTRAAIATGDRATAFLYYRYTQGRRDLADLLSELEPLFAPPDRFKQQRDLEARIRAAKALPIAISSARRRVDGSDAQMLAAMRQQLRSLV